MKLRIITIILTVLVVSMTLVSCIISLPMNESASSSGEKSEAPAEDSAEKPSADPVSEPEESVERSAEESSGTPAEESSEANAESSEPVFEESSEAPEESSESAVVQPSEPAEESSEQTSEPVSQPEEYSYIPDVAGLPYTTYKGLTKSNIKTSELDEYFKDSMFIGLSILVHFKNYTDSMQSRYPGFLGNAIIFARSNFSAYNNFRYKPTDEDSVHPLYNGQKMTCEDAVKESGVKTVYLTVMALNELGIYKDDCVKKTFDSTVKLINAIKAKSPSVNIVVLSNTYMVYDFNNFKNLNNGNISALNNMVLDYCNKNGMDFIDVSTMLMKGNVLDDDLCRDAHSGSGCHLTNDAYAMWTAVLRNYAYLKQKGLYRNPQFMPTYTKNK